MRYRFWFLLILLFTLVFSFSFVFAETVSSKNLEIKFFYSQSCPYCNKEKDFLQGIEQNYSRIELNQFEVSQNVDLLKDFYEDYDVPPRLRGGVPITFIEGEYFVGFDESIGERIEECINQKLEQDNGEPCEDNEQQGTTSKAVVDKEINVPLIGKIKVEDYSLPVLAVLLGFLDGFNLCSLGALILILGLALSLRSRSKILFFGSIFILTTGVAYGFLIVLWYKLFSALAQYIRSMEILIGSLAAIGSIYFFWQFFKFRKKRPTCEMGQQDIVSIFSSRLKKAFENPEGILGLGALILLFSAVLTVVEFPCSAALPVAYAGILAKAQPPTFLYLLYITIFVLFYMLDEIVIFLGAFFSMKIWLTSPKFVTWATLVEALFLLGLGLYYLGLL